MNNSSLVIDLYRLEIMGLNWIVEIDNEIYAVNKIYNNKMMLNDGNCKRIVNDEILTLYLHYQNKWVRFNSYDEINYYREYRPIRISHLRRLIHLYEEETYIKNRISEFNKNS